MRTLAVIVGFIAGLVSVAAVADAGTLASSFIRGPSTSSIQCVVANVGTKPVTVISADIIDGAGNSENPGDGCTGTLAPGMGCSMEGNYYGRGVIVVQGSTKSLRGQCVANDANDVDTAASEMH